MRTAMIAITTNSSIRVNARRMRRRPIRDVCGREGRDRTAELLGGWDGSEARSSVGAA